MGYFRDIVVLVAALWVFPTEAGVHPCAHDIVIGSALETIKFESYIPKVAPHAQEIGDHAAQVAKALVRGAPVFDGLMNEPWIEHEMPWAERVFFDQFIVDLTNRFIRTELDQRHLRYRTEELLGRLYDGEVAPEGIVLIDGNVAANIPISLAQINLSYLLDREYQNAPRLLYLDPESTPVAPALLDRCTDLFWQGLGITPPFELSSKTTHITLVGNTIAAYHRLLHESDMLIRWHDQIEGDLHIVIDTRATLLGFDQEERRYIVSDEEYDEAIGRGAVDADFKYETMAKAFATVPGEARRRALQSIARWLILAYDPESSPNFPMFASRVQFFKPLANNDMAYRFRFIRLPKGRSIWVDFK